MSIEVNSFFGTTSKSRWRILWAHLFEKGICFAQDLLDENGKFLSLDDLQVKYKVHLNFLQYFQRIAVIPSCLKKTVQKIAVTKRDLLKATKLRCKDYYNLFQEGKTTEPTAVKRWSSFFPYFATSWEQSFSTIYKWTKDNKLREFSIEF